MDACSTTWTAADLAAIEAAIASGATKVKYADREVTYGSIADLFKIRAAIKAALGCCGGSLAGGRTYGEFHSGL